jgi:hypothetical protein
MKPFHVLHKIPLLAECPLAHLTAVGPLPRVNSHVSSEMAALPEALATNLAAVRSDARVGAQMASQAAALAEKLQAQVTLVALSGRRQQRIAAACRSAQQSPSVFEELQAAGQGLVLQCVELVVSGERSGQRELLRTALALIAQSRVNLHEGLLIDSFISKSCHFLDGIEGPESGSLAKGKGRKRDQKYVKPILSAPDPHLLGAGYPGLRKNNKRRPKR